jgi:hypothetical protein
MLALQVESEQRVKLVQEHVQGALHPNLMQILGAVENTDTIDIVTTDGGDLPLWQYASTYLSTGLCTPAFRALESVKLSSQVATATHHLHTVLNAIYVDLKGDNVMVRILNKKATLIDLHVVFGDQVNRLAYSSTPGCSSPEIGFQWIAHKLFGADVCYHNPMWVVDQLLPSLPHIGKLYFSQFLGSCPKDPVSTPTDVYSCSLLLLNLLYPQVEMQLYDLAGNIAASHHVVQMIAEADVKNSVALHLATIHMAHSMDQWLVPLLSTAPAGIRDALMGGLALDVSSRITMPMFVEHLRVAAEELQEQVIAEAVAAAVGRVQGQAQADLRALERENGVLMAQAVTMIEQQQQELDNAAIIARVHEAIIDHQQQQLEAAKAESAAATTPEAAATTATAAAAAAASTPAAAAAATATTAAAASTLAAAATATATTAEAAASTTPAIAAAAMTMAAAEAASAPTAAATVTMAAMTMAATTTAEAAATARAATAAAPITAAAMTTSAAAAAMTTTTAAAGAATTTAAAEATTMAAMTTTTAAEAAATARAAPAAATVTVAAMTTSAAAAMTTTTAAEAAATARAATAAATNTAAAMTTSSAAEAAAMTTTTAAASITAAATTTSAAAESAATTTTTAAASIAAAAMTTSAAAEAAATTTTTAAAGVTTTAAAATTAPAAGPVSVELQPSGPNGHCHHQQHDLIAPTGAVEAAAIEATPPLASSSAALEPSSSAASPVVSPSKPLLVTPPASEGLGAEFRRGSGRSSARVTDDYNGGAVVPPARDSDSHKALAVFSKRRCEGLEALLWEGRKAERILPAAAARADGGNALQAAQKITTATIAAAATAESVNWWNVPGAWRPFRGAGDPR